MSVRLGDVRKTVNVQPRPRPELEEVTVRLKLPDYLQYKTQPSIAVRSGSVSLLKGSQASFEARARPAAGDGGTRRPAADRFRRKDHDRLRPGRRRRGP